MNDLLDILGRPIHLILGLKGWYCVNGINLTKINECVIYVKIKSCLIVLDYIVNDIVIYLEFKLTRYITWRKRPHTNIQLAAYTSSGKIQYFMDWGDLKLQTEQEMINYCEEQDTPYKIYETY